MGAERLVMPAADPQDRALDRAVRPKRLAEFVGQHAVRE